MQRALERQVLDVLALAPEEPGVLLAQDAIAEDAHASEPNEPSAHETTACTAAVTSERPGRYASSSGGLNGIGRERRANSLDRRVELVEHGGLNLRGQLGAEAAVRHGLVRDDQSVRLRDGLDDRLEVERDERPRIDHLDLDAFSRELARPTRATRGRAATARDSHVSPRPGNLRAAEGHGAGSAGISSRRK